MYVVSQPVKIDGSSAAMHVPSLGSVRTKTNSAVVETERTYGSRAHTNNYRYCM
jgi:hypothetical protein